ncbi:MAG: hypothetical protein IAE64_03930 [Flavobacteriales bacterium]|nr:MAG: hypothetical protein F9K28_02855 [Bacteroidota bacterium]KXK35685.1 MAG: hypothetical protein UZ06_CHB003000419 [Chlorobi bacterium OLB6]MBE2265381.1 hypothetical protein [Flavobacteriales bacterium]MBV6463772.1 hypothetical protein [Chlorobiota bacterium]MBW7853643.1 hypothetical protein [Candidatus Kapabacteria bacterium]MCC6332123.1 hypothetical protein [Ignavibacteria bacterium]
MMIKILIVVIALLVSVTAKAQQQIDTVLRFTPGRGEAVGRGPAFFPMNIFRGPDAGANDTVPTLDPREICALGLDGEIIVGIKNYVLVDGPGPDFTIFENVFVGPLGKVFAEPAEISVSTNGTDWHVFPFDSLTLEGCAGRTPTNHSNHTTPGSGGGDVFDLASIGADSVRWIRIRDLCAMILANKRHPYYDPTISGFDLDAVLCYHTAPAPTATALACITRTAIVQTTVRTGGTLYIHDTAGRLLQQMPVPGGITNIPMYHLPAECLLVTLDADNTVQTLKVLR